MRTIELTQGKVATVDDDDFEWLSQLMALSDLVLDAENYCRQNTTSLTSLIALQPTVP